MLLIDMLLIKYNVYYVYVHGCMQTHIAVYGESNFSHSFPDCILHSMVMGHTFGQTLQATCCCEMLDAWAVSYLYI